MKEKRLTKVSKNGMISDRESGSKSKPKSARRAVNQRGTNVNYCLNCGRKVVSKTGDKIYCGIKCRDAAYRKRHGQPLTKIESKRRLKMVKPNHCIRCGKVFGGNPFGRPAKFCKDGCRVLYCRERNKTAIRFMRMMFPDRAEISAKEAVTYLESNQFSYDPKGKFWREPNRLIG